MFPRIELVQELSGGFDGISEQDRSAYVRESLFIITVSQVAGSQNALVAPENILRLEGIAVWIPTRLDADLWLILNTTM